LRPYDFQIKIDSFCRGENSPASDGLQNGFAGLTSRLTAWYLIFMRTELQSTDSYIIGAGKNRCHGLARYHIAILLVTLIISEGEGRPLFSDGRFRRGFRLSYPDSSRGRAVEAILNLNDEKNEPIWRLCQWGTKYSLASSPRIQGSTGDIWYENPAKKVLVGGQNSGNRDLMLELKGKAEYGNEARKYGESWPHLLVEQDATMVYPLDRLRRVDFQINLKLLYIENHMKESEYDPSLHAAQFQMFFIVKNVSRQTRDYADYFWFGVPFFDSRHEIPPAHMARDAGKADATGKFIYTIDGKTVNTIPLRTGRWVAVEKDLLPYIKDGLREAVKRGYLGSANLHNYGIVNVNLGWEIPGIFDTAMQIREFDVYVVPTDK
jgi:hypothetical protein